MLSVTSAKGEKVGKAKLKPVEWKMRTGSRWEGYDRAKWAKLEYNSEKCRLRDEKERENVCGSHLGRSECDILAAKSERWADSEKRVNSVVADANGDLDHKLELNRRRWTRHFKD